jgi:hypothetical protein
MGVNSLTHPARRVKKRGLSPLSLWRQRGQASESNYNCEVRVETLCALLVALVTLAAAAGCSSGGPGEAESAGVKATYSKSTGKLELITYDTNKDGKVDAWGHMEGTRLVWMDIDRNFDGVLDRWEYFSADGALEKVGFSRANDGKVDAWAFQGADGQMSRIEVSTRRDGTVNRLEFYEGGKLVRTEEDANGDGRPEKWETWRDGALASVELDTNRDGQPDRRLTYGPRGVKTTKLR